MVDILEQIDSRYKILQKIGIKVQANIFLVEEKNTKIIYVAKVSQKESESDFDSEVKILNSLQKLNSPYILRIINSGDAEIIIKNRQTALKNIHFINMSDQLLLRYIILENASKLIWENILDFLKKDLEKEKVN